VASNSERELGHGSLAEMMAIIKLSASSPTDVPRIYGAFFVREEIYPVGVVIPHRAPRFFHPNLLKLKLPTY